MSAPPPPPDDATIEAWLSGELSHQEAAGLEQYFAQNPPLEQEVPSALRHLGTGARPEREVTQLVQLLRNLGPVSLPPTRPDAWKELLTDSEKDGVLGTLGSYEVLEVIASGGMGIVFRARDPELNRIAALKALSPDLASNGTARTRFLREARAAAALEDDNILPLYSVHNDPSPWFAMRYVGGGTLQDALDQGEDFPLARLKSIAQQVASALAAAHRAQIIHRDIKPANILLEEKSDRIWVGDFGIARSIEDPSLTYAGNVAGTPLYMSPEQAEGMLLDGRSDLFSLGSVLYHCATGQSPFAGETSAAVLQNVSKGKLLKLRSLNRKLPSWFERFLEKLLEKDPAQRYSSAEEVIRALEVEQTPLSKKKKNQQAALLIGAAATLLLVGLLQLPSLRDLTNRALIPVTGHRFSIQGRLGTSGSFAQAIERAKAHETILLHGDEPIPVDIVTIPAEKPLTLRPGRDSHPVLLSTSPNSHLKSFSSVEVMGLTFRSPAMARTSPPALSLLGPENVLRDCLFDARHQPSNFNSAGRPAAIMLGNEADLLVEDCRFELSEVAAVAVWDRRPEDPKPIPKLVHFSRSLITGSRSVTIIRVDHSIGLRLRYRDCLVATDCIVMDYWNQGLKPVVIESTDSIFAPQHAFLWGSGERKETATSRIEWRSKNDIFRREIPFFSNALVLPQPKEDSLIHSRAQWQREATSDFQGSRDLAMPFPKTPSAPLTIAAFREQLGLSKTPDRE